MTSKKTLLKEYYVDPGVIKHLEKLGYKKLGKGQDQIAFLEPSTGMVLKIFGSSISGETGFTKPQMSFKVFADYCQANSDNPFLPQFYGWETFKFKGKTYLQIRMERLFQFPGVEHWADALEVIVIYAEMSKSPEAKEKFIEEHVKYEFYETYQQLFTHLGREGFDQLWNTIYDLNRIAEKHGFRLDLHAGNFMMGSDGEIVINDPFFTGWANR